jgi:hypothetical protein
MNRGSSVWQWEQTTDLVCEGEIDSSPSQARHLTSIMASMKPLLLILLVAVSVQAQSLADAARKERERQTTTKSTRVIISTGKILEPTPTAADESKPADAKAADPKGTSTGPAKEAPKAQAPPADPVQVWNNQLNQLRSKIRGLQDQEMALLLQQNQITNQVYAPVTDPATQDRALAQLGQVQQQIATVRKDLEEAKKMLDSLQLQGPPKK